jgi:rubrerythrin
MKLEGRMTFEEAIMMAIEYETKVRDAYLNSVDDIADKAGRRVFRVLGEEEQGHIDYLRTKLEEWQYSGTVSAAKLETAVPPAEIIEAGVRKLDDHLSERDSGTEREMVRKALALEQETSDFYHRMVDELGEQGKFFGRFVEIEDGHLAIVQAELDYITRSGTFFDFVELNQEY